MALLHLLSVHKVGGNNPDGIDLEKKDKIPFHPYYTVKDAFTFGIYMILFFVFVFFMPNSLGHPDNYIMADPMVTPAHIVPEWYFLPFYAILRSIPNKLMGVIAMFGSIVILTFLPWIDTSKVRSGKYRPVFKWVFWGFLLDFVVLTKLGGLPPTGIYVPLARIATFLYFSYFPILFFLGRFEKTLPVPKKIKH